MAATEKVIRKAAEKFLASEGRDGAEVHPVDRVAPDVFWVAYMRNGSAHTAIVSGSKKDWTLLKTLAGWPPPP